jgi:RNA polymerase sigma factor (sigma-70 family)
MTPTESVPGDLAPGEVEVIQRKARSMVRRGLVPRGDLEDVRQDLAAALLAARAGFDPEVGGREAFARVVVRRAGSKIVRARRAAKRDPARVRPLEDPATRAAPADPDASQRRTDLALDVGELLRRLPENLRAVARLLERVSVTEAARVLGVPRTTLNDRIRVLREAFDRAGLRVYLPAPPVTSPADG